MARLTDMEMRASGPIGQSMIEDGVFVVRSGDHFDYDYTDPETRRQRTITRSEAQRLLSGRSCLVDGWHWEEGR